jgi:fatty acid desaturase
MTAFKTRSVNDWVARYCGIVMCIPPRFFQLEHTQHHTYTQDIAYDPQHIGLPRTLGSYLLYLSALPYWRSQLTTLLRHACGQINQQESLFTAAVQRPMVIMEARTMLVIYLVLLSLSVYFAWYWPVYLWLAPLLIAEPAMRFIRMTEHVGQPLVPDLTKNTRTCRVAWPLRSLCWNMNYHAEHHFAPSVPFHALPELHQKIGHYLPNYPGYFAAHRSILQQVRPDTRQQ